MRTRILWPLPLIALAACEAGTTGGGPSAGAAIGGTGGSAATKVTLARSGADSCGAADFAFLTGQPFAHTFDIAIPAGTRYFGRLQKADSLNNPSRLNINVSTREAFEANTDGKATITKVYCG